MPPVAYALASDTLIGVVRATALARHRARASGSPTTSPPRWPSSAACCCGCSAWPSRPPRRCSGFRALGAGGVPGRAGPPHRHPPAHPRPPPRAGCRPPPRVAAPACGARAGTKTAAFLAMVTQRHGPLAGIPLSSVSRISAQVAPRVGLNAGAARTALRTAILAAQEGEPDESPSSCSRARHGRDGRGVGVPSARTAARATGPGTCGSASTCGCIPARASPRSPRCGCGGAGSPPCASPAGPAARWPFWQRALRPAAHSVLLGRAHYRHGLRVPLEEHVLVIAPPRTYKTAFLADVILRYPGPVIVHHDQGRRVPADHRQRGPAVGPVHVFNPQAIGGVASTFRWSQSTAARTRRPRSAGPTRSPTRSARRASRRPRSGRRRRRTTCAPTSTPPRWPATTCTRSPRWVARRPSRRGRADPRRRRRAPMGDDPRRDASARRRRPPPTVRMVMSRALAFMTDPALAAPCCPPRARLRHCRFPAPSGAPCT